MIRKTLSTQKVVIVLLCLMCIFVPIYLFQKYSRDGRVALRGLYQSQPTYSKYHENSDRYKIMLVSDMDHDSKIDTYKWKAHLKEGILDYEDGWYTFRWEEDTLIHTEFNEKGRGMELSDLVYFNDRLLACDDRTGILFEIVKEKQLAIPQQIFTGGDGRSTSKGFKCEWLAVKEDKLYIGSTGKEYVQDGVIVNYDAEWVKTMDTLGRVEHIHWKDRYNRLRKVSGADFPGYLIHEAVGWSQMKKQWVFLPRRHSTDPYDDVIDELKGTNLGLLADESFKTVSTIKVGTSSPTLGVSSFKFVPYREDHILVLKTEEYRGAIRTIAFVYDMKKNEVVSDEVEVSDTIKFEGVEFV